jgi:hypothetical protein
MPTDKKISELPVAASINAADVSVLVNNDTDYQYTFTLLLQFLEANLATGARISFGTTLPQNITGSNGDVFVNTAAASFAQKIAGTWTIVYTLPAANAADGTLLYGAGLPGAATGKNTDSYINTLTGIFYQKSTGTWAQVFSMANGPQGPQGTAGANGTNGINGNTILFGTGNPSNSTTGVDGNFYINTTTYNIFGPKTAGAWGSSVSMIGAGIATGGTTGQILTKADGTDYNTTWEDNSFANISGQPADNANMANALALKASVTDLNTEITARSSADTILQTNINNEIANRVAADALKADLVSGKVPASQLPAYVDEIQEFASLSAFPNPGATGIIYIATDTNFEYRWSGSAYIQLVASPGTTDAVSEGSTNLYFKAARVLATILTGIGFSTATAVLATDSILQAIGKLQAQVTTLFNRSIPAGGTTGQVLAKASNTDYDDHWVDVATGGGSSILTATALGINDYTATIDPTIITYNNTQIFSIKFTNGNTGPASLNLNSIGEKPIVKNGDIALIANDILPGQIVILAFDGTNFQVINAFPATLPTVISGEKILSITATGPQINYDLQDQVVSAASLTSADFSTGVANVTGLQGQYAYDNNYKYDCIGINQWRRSALNGNLIDLYLADIDDSAGDKTTSDLNFAYPSSLPGQQVWGTNKLYIKKTSTLWKKTPIATA